MNATRDRLVVLPRAARAEWLKAHNARNALLAGGHSMFKAERILVDCRRGDRNALSWLLSFMAAEVIGSH